eukprot:16451808-Heterocapsa_arctica.AAC.1
MGGITAHMHSQNVLLSEPFQISFRDQTFKARGFHSHFEHNELLQAVDEKGAQVTGAVDEKGAQVTGHALHELLGSKGGLTAEGEELGEELVQGSSI